MNPLHVNWNYPTAIKAGQNRPVWDFEDVDDNYLRADVAAMAPVIAVPTTAGTGSEVGRTSIGIPHSLGDIGIPSDRIADIGRMATADASAQTNPVLYTAREYSRILEHALSGAL